MYHISGCVVKILYPTLPRFQSKMAIVWDRSILALVTTKRVPPGKMAATGNVLAGNAPNKDHISCGNDSCGHDTKGGDPTKRPTTIYDAVKSGFVAFFCIFIISFEVAIGIDRSFPKTSAV